MFVNIGIHRNPLFLFKLICILYIIQIHLSFKYSTKSYVCFLILLLHLFSQSSIIDVMQINVFSLFLSLSPSLSPSLSLALSHSLSLSLCECVDLDI